MVFMNTRLSGWCLSALLGLTPVSSAFSQAPPTPADISRIVAEATTYQSGQSLEPFRTLEDWARQSVGKRPLQRQLQPGLIQLLGPASTFEAQRFACKLLAVIGDEQSLPALANLLKNDSTAGIACLALTTYPPGSADETLRNALAPAHGAAQIQIVNALGDRRDSLSVKLLVPLAHDADRVVAEAAIASLGKIGDKPAQAALTSLRHSAPPALEPAVTAATLRCAQTLAAAGRRKAAVALYEQLLTTSQPPSIRRAALGALFGLDKDRGERRIVQVLRGSDAALKPVAIAAVPSLRAKGASAKFAAELPRLQPDEQVWLIDSLAARADPAARKAVAQAAASPHPTVRLTAISALGRIGDASDVALLARRLAQGPDADERRAIESSLCNLSGGDRTDAAILAELKRASGAARVSLISPLAQREGAEANRVLFEETDNPDPAVAKAAFRALGKTAIGSDLPILLDKTVAAGDAEVRASAESAAAQALARVDSPAQRSALVRNSLGRAQTIEGRAAMFALLPNCGDSDALAALQAAARDLDVRVRTPAVRALADWPNDSSWDTLAAIYRQPESETFRRIALPGLLRLADEANAHPDPKLVERYRLLLAGAHGDADLKQILGALGSAAHPGALDLALPFLDNPGVKAEAQVAVKLIAQAIKAEHPKAAEEALARLQSKP